MSDFETPLQRIEERLRGVELLLGQLATQLKTENTNTMQTIVQLQRVCESHAKLLFGQNGHSLLTRMAMLEDAEQRRKWSLRVVWGAVVSMMIKVFTDILRF